MFVRYAEVAFRLPLRGTFTYSVPEDLGENVLPGMRVKTIFNHREEEGIILSLHQSQPEYRVSPLQGLIDREAILNQTQLDLAGWMSEFYLAGIGECLFKMFPQAKRFPAQRTVRSIIPDHCSNLHRLNDEQERIFRAVLKEGIFQDDRSPGPSEEASPASTHLIQGVTGSGKTEIYIHLILEALKRDRGTVLLVPEIALTVQLINRLRCVFGDELALLHSALKKSERFAAYISLLRGERKIAVGTRSAVFAPVQNPALFILDEEHDASYKEHSAPRYHARQIAYRRAGREDALLLLGSATPALETRYQATSGRKSFTFHRLDKRAAGSRLPQVELIGAPSMDVPLTGTLLREMEINLKKGRQTIILLNRRGYHPYLYCPECGEARNCPHCSVTLHLHGDGILQCHYCGYRQGDDGSCPRCAGPTRKLGIGTQKLEEFLFNRFPGIRLERLDTDVTRNRDAAGNAIEKLLNNELDVLIGTQMIAKGLDAPNVTLVGVLQADQGLNIPDFRAAERTFSLLMQVAGRAGRREETGRVYFEVLNTENEIVKLARSQDYDSFFENEMRNRRESRYPPFTRLIRFLYRSVSDESAGQSAAALAVLLRREMNGEPAEMTEIIGPAPAPLGRLQKYYRHHIIIKTLRPARVREIVSENFELVQKTKVGDSHLEIDMDPTDLF